MASGIPIGEFVRLLDQAEKAIVKNDMAQLDSINEALKRVGQRVIVKDGKAYLQTIVDYQGPG
jgi:hypothetical protein